MAQGPEFLGRFARPLLSIQQSPGPPLFCPLKLIRAFRQEPRNLTGFSIRVDGDKREIRRTGVSPLLFVQVLTIDIDLDLHRGPPDVGQTRGETGHLANLDRGLEGNRVDRDRDDGAPGMTVRRNRSCQVHPVHDRTTENRPVWIGLPRQYQLNHLCGGLCRRLGLGRHCAAV